MHCIVVQLIITDPFYLYLSVFVNIFSEGADLAFAHILDYFWFNLCFYSINHQP